MTDDEVLGRRALNRALLARQSLLKRERVAALDLVERLGGLQAQAAMPPYQGLWSRIEGFDPAELAELLVERRVVRMTLMRGTIHLVSVADARLLRPLMQPAIERVYGLTGKRGEGIDRPELERAVREIIAGEPLTAREIATQALERGVAAGADLETARHAVVAFVPLVQVPPRGVWGQGGRARYLPFEAWTGQELDSEPAIEPLVLRYLGAFGPASVMDMQYWSGLTRLRSAFERLRKQLVTFRDEDGVELFDLPDAPRPDPETPAPVRLLGEYDNVLIAHRDRRRIIPADFPWEEMLAGGRYVNNLLVDGTLRATWWIERQGSQRATLAIRPFGRLSAAERRAVADEAERMAAFSAPEPGERDVRFEAPAG